MQDDMVAELKAAGTSLPPTAIEAAPANYGHNDGSDRPQALEEVEDFSSTSRAAASKQTTPLVAAKKRPAPSQAPPAKRGKVGGRTGGKGKKKPGRPAATSAKGGAKRPTRTRLSISDFDGVTQVGVHFRREGGGEREESGFHQSIRVHVYVLTVCKRSTFLSSLGSLPGGVSLPSWVGYFVTKSTRHSSA